MVSDNITNLEQVLTEEAEAISKGAHFYDALPRIGDPQLNLSNETVKLLQLETIMRSLAIHYWDESKSKLVIPKDLKDCCINEFLKSGISSDYNHAKQLLEVGISYYNLVRNADIVKP